MSGRRQATYDLHLHTYWSYDALANPEAHFVRARALGMRCIAITEHHLIDSQDEVKEIGVMVSRMSIWATMVFRIVRIRLWVKRMSAVVSRSPEGVRNRCPRWSISWSVCLNQSS